MGYITDKEKKYLIRRINETDKDDEDESFDLGKFLRDYGMIVMSRCITNDIIKE
jgi:hypothetical protein